MLAQLPLPALERGDVFHLLSSAYGSGHKLLRELKERDFVSPEEFCIAQQTGILWLYENEKEDDSQEIVIHKKAASRLDLLLLPAGGTQEQLAAVDLFSTHFSTHLLGLNQHRHDCEDTLERRWQYLAELEVQREKNGFLVGTRLFSDVPEEQSDREKIHSRGLWTLHDKKESNLVAAGSTPEMVLKKAWRVAPALEPLRRLSALDTQLPAPRPRKGPGRF